MGKHNLRQDLRRLLHSAELTGARAEELRRMGRLAEAAEDPCARTHFTPGHFTASAFVLSPDGRSLLLILHRKLGLWLQPGGHIDPSDPTILAAARREAAEETGLVQLELAQHNAGLFDIDIHTIPAHRDEPEHAHFDLRFLFRATTMQLRAGDDAADARWVPLGALADFDTDASVRQTAARIA